MRQLGINLLMATAILLTASQGSAEPTQKTNSIHTGGKTYPIEEIDALEDISARAEKADVKGFVNKTPREKWSLWRGYPLPAATKNIKRTHVPWYSLEMDIKDAKGNIIYPKGFTYNPLAHMKLPQRIVVYKIGQFEKIKRFTKESDVLIADSGDVIEEGNKHNRHVSILSEQIAKRLSLKRLPSFVEQQGQALLITEINVSEL